MKVPSELIYPLPRFAEAHFERAKLGMKYAAEASVVFVGLARNCEQHLTANLTRLQILAESFGEWRLHIETNDNEDGTAQVLADFCGAYRQATFASHRLGRGQYGNEFAGRRTVAMAEYRTACQRWVADNARNAEYVVIVDWDAWGGWSHDGLMAGLGWLNATPDAYGMASVSVMQHPAAVSNGQETKIVEMWMHYDAWALRLNSTYDDYSAGQGAWKQQWIPPVGSPPIPVVSAFGGMAIYDTYAYLKGTYDGSDCEHVPFHASIAERTGQQLYLCPSMRTVMHWLLEEGDDAGHRLNGV